jgi:hypothetical protein
MANRHAVGVGVSPRHFILSFSILLKLYDLSIAKVPEQNAMDHHLARFLDFSNLTI